MIEELPEVAADGAARITAAPDLDALREVEADLLGKKGRLTQLKKQLGALDPDARRAAGQALNDTRSTLDAALSERRVALSTAARAEQLAAEHLDLTEITEERRRGSLHLVTQTWDRLVDVFVGMGFTVAEGPEVETDWHNFEALNIPAAHPARGMWDTLYVTSASPRPSCCAPTRRPCRSG